MKIDSIEVTIENEDGVKSKINLSFAAFCRHLSRPVIEAKPSAVEVKAPTVEAKPSTPAVEVKPSTPAVEAKPSTPAVEAKAPAPAVEAKDNYPGYKLIKSREGLLSIKFNLPFCNVSQALATSGLSYTYIHLKKAHALAELQVWFSNSRGIAQTPIH